MKPISMAGHGSLAWYQMIEFSSFAADGCVKMFELSGSGSVADGRIARAAC